MFDVRIRRVIDPWLDRIAARCVSWGIGANAITGCGFALGMLGCVAIACEHPGLAMVLILLNRLADGLDGAVARHNIIFDAIFYSGVPFAFAIAQPDDRLAATFLIYSFIGTGGSFLAFATIAAKPGITADRQGKKSFYYAAGLMEGTETVAFFILCCLLPERFSELAWVFGTLRWVTTALRIAAGTTLFRESAVEGLP